MNASRNDVSVLRGKISGRIQFIQKSAYSVLPLHIRMLVTMSMTINKRKSAKWNAKLKLKPSHKLFYIVLLIPYFFVSVFVARVLLSFATWSHIFAILFGIFLFFSNGKIGIWQRKKFMKNTSWMVLSLRNGISDVPMYNVQLTVQMNSEYTIWQKVFIESYGIQCKQVENILYISLLLLGQRIVSSLLLFSHIEN